MVNTAEVKLGDAMKRHRIVIRIRGAKLCTARFRVAVALLKAVAIILPMNVRLAIET